MHDLWRNHAEVTVHASPSSPFSGPAGPFTRCRRRDTLSEMLTRNFTLTRILIANMPKMLQEMIASIISSEPRFSIVGKLPTDADLLSAIRRIGPEVVITQESPKQRGEEGKRNPDAQCCVNVLAINETGQEAALYSLTLEEMPLGDISACGLISAIDKAAERL